MLWVFILSIVLFCFAITVAVAHEKVNFACVNVACVNFACVNVACVNFARVNVACVNVACVNVACVNVACGCLMLVITQDSLDV